MYLKRISLFLATNLGVLLVLSVALKLLGIDRWIQAEIGLDYRSVLLVAALFGFGGAFVSLALSKWLARSSMQLTMIDGSASEGERWLFDTIAELARRSKIGMPEIGVFESPDVNAFATGARRDHALVAVSTGLLRTMNRDEIEAVLGHEITHVANGDMVTMALLQGVLNTFVIFVARLIGVAVDRTIFRQERGRGPGFWVTNIVMQLVLGLLATLIVMAFSRRREFRADAGSADLVGPARMVGALRRLQQAAELPSDLPDGLRTFGIRGGPSLSGLFRSHPPLEQRIEAIERRSGTASERRPVTV